MSTNQPYKKNFKRHVILALVLFGLSYLLGNFITLLPGYDVYSKFLSFISKDMGQFIMMYFVDFFIKPSLLGLFMGYFGFMIGMYIYVHDNDKGIYRNGEEHGSARFATREEMEKFADEDPKLNILYTRYAYMGLCNKRLEFEFQKNKNSVVVGGPGSGKTFTFIKPNLMQMNASFIVTDPKGLLVHEIGKMLKEAGYDLKIFNLATLLNSDGFNLFKYIKTELDVDRVLEFITEGTKKGEAQGEDFWRQAEALLIRAFIAYLWFDGKDNDYLPHIGMVADMLRLTERIDPDVPSPVETWFEEQNERHPNNYAYKQWSLFNQLYRSETRMSVLAIAAGRYSVFDHEQVVDMVREDTMDIESWNEKKTAVFITMPETSDTYNFLSAIFLGTAMEVLRKKADEVLTGARILKAGKKLLHIRFLLDEFANIGRIPNIDKALATFRSREMSIVIVLQALDQLKTMYRHGWSTIVDTCDSFLFLGGNDAETTKYLSVRAGKQTISVRKRNLQRSGRGGSSENRDKMGRDLLTQDEIGRLNGTDALLFISGEQVFKDKKYTVSDHENAHLLADSPSDPNWYRYKRYRNEVEELLDKVRKEDIVNHGTVFDEVA